MCNDQRCYGAYNARMYAFLLCASFPVGARRTLTTTYPPFVLKFTTSIAFLTEVDGVSAFFSHTKHLAIVLSSSILGHVCGGVAWGWLSRNTHALKQKGGFSLLRVGK